MYKDPSQFWKDLHTSISYLCRDIIHAKDVRISFLVTELRKAGVQRCSENLLYAWADPEKEQLPSLRAFLLLIKITGIRAPIDDLAAACGKRAIKAEAWEQIKESVKKAE